jgi:peptidoglycan-associated lipoprotein
MKNSTLKAVAVRHVVILLALSIGLSGCTTCQKIWDRTMRRHSVTTAPPESTATTVESTERSTRPIPAEVTPGPVTEAPRPTEAGGPIAALEKVHFDYDSAALRADARAILDKDIEWLKGNAAIRVQIEGHCDERGTEEYNTALGERRAQSVKDYLVKNGIDAGRLFPISYGESRPADTGHDESAWWKNRRAEFSSLR